MTLYIVDMRLELEYAASEGQSRYTFTEVTRTVQAATEDAAKVRAVREVAATITPAAWLAYDIRTTGCREAVKA